MKEGIERLTYDVTDRLKRAGRRLAEGWHELWRRADDRHDRELGVERIPRGRALGGGAYERDDEIVVRMDLPGLDRDDIRLSVERGLLRISGDERRDREERRGPYYLRERAYGRFERVIRLPDDVEVRKARATCKDGVLTVRLPKARLAAARRVAVQ